MDISGINCVGIAAIITAIGSVIGVFKANSTATKAQRSADDIVSSRVITRTERDSAHQELVTRVAVLERNQALIEKRLDEGNTNFKRIEAKLDQTNLLINRLIGFVKAGGLQRLNSQPIDSNDGGMGL